MVSYSLIPWPDLPTLDRACLGRFVIVYLLILNFVGMMVIEVTHWTCLSLLPKYQACIIGEGLVLMHDSLWGLGLFGSFYFIKTSLKLNQN